MRTKFPSLRRSGGTARHELVQLLMIVSDGKGLHCLSGVHCSQTGNARQTACLTVDTVKQAVRRALNSGIFLIFVIIDNPSSKVRFILAI